MKNEELKQNQEMLDKILRDNEDLLVMAEGYKQQIENAKCLLQTCKTDTLKLIQPEIQKILEDHKNNLELQDEQYRKKIELAQVKFQKEKEKLQQEFKMKKTEILEKNHETLKKMKMNALEKESNIKISYKEKMASIPQQEQEAYDIEVQKLQNERLVWQQRRSNEMREEIEKECKIEAKRAREKQNKILEEIVGKLQLDAHEENRALEEKLTKIKDKNRAEELNLHKEEESLISELKNLKKGIVKKEDIVQESQDKIQQCKCKEYQIQIDQLKMRIDTLKQKLSDETKTHEQDEENAQKILNENQKVLIQVQQELKSVQEEFIHQKEISDKKIHSIEVKHQEEMQLLGGRIKQAVHKKDEYIQQLILKIESLGNPNLLSQLK